MTLLPATRETVAGLEFDTVRLVEALRDESLIATDLADELVRRGVPFREAHGAVGRLIRQAEQVGVSPAALDDDAWAQAHPAFLVGGRPVFDAERSVEVRSVAGGTARSAVLEQLDSAQSALSRGRSHAR
jgi:argininosuccinate lyase